jgi:hypothetical protein
VSLLATVANNSIENENVVHAPHGIEKTKQIVYIHSSFGS